MSRILVAVLIVLVTVPHLGVDALAQAQDAPVGGPTADLNCPNFDLLEDAQAVYDAARTADNADPYDLDGEGDEENFIACDGADDLGDGPLATCAGFKTQGHAQALLDVAGADVGYDLDANGDDVACSPDAAGAPPVPAPSAPSAPAAPAVVDAEGCDVEVENGRAYAITDCADGTVRAGFLPFEGFDAFAERAQNGFGAFDDGDGGATITVETKQAALPAGSSGGTTSPDRGAGESRVVESEQQTARQSTKKKRKAARKRQRTRERKVHRQRLEQQRNER